MNKIFTIIALLFFSTDGFSQAGMPGKAFTNMQNYNGAGKVVKQQQWNLAEDSTSLSVDVKGLTNGLYYLELKGETINEYKQFIKQ